MTQKQSNNVNSTFIVNNMKFIRKLKRKYMSKIIYMCTAWDPGVPAIHTKDQTSFALISVKSRVRLHCETGVETAQWCTIIPESWKADRSPLLHHWRITFRLLLLSDCPFLWLSLYAFVWWNSKSPIKSFRKGRKAEGDRKGKLL